MALRELTFITAVLVATAGCNAEEEVVTTAGPPVTATVTHAANQPGPVPVTNSFRHVLRSAEIGQDFVIDVALPYLPSDEPMPVIYVTDGNSMFPLVANSARLMQLGFEIPPVIVVGIGYEVDSSAEVLNLRSRDLTPTVDEAFLERSASDPMPRPSDLSLGQAAQFLDFIENDVKPLIAANYPVLDGDATLVGDSLGGLFTLYALFNRTGDYQRFIAGSPSLWWDEETLFEDEARYATSAEDIDARLFLSVGGLEEGPADDGFHMVTNTHRMADLLASRAYPSLHLTVHEFADETHLSVIPATMSRGLRAVFADEVAALQLELAETQK